MREIITLCDICGDRISLGTRAAREFEVNGKPINCCGIKCFMDFWASNYTNWERLQVSLQTDEKLAEPQLEVLKKEAK
jgi:hypothetical protein